MLLSLWSTKSRIGRSLAASLLFALAAALAGCMPADQPDAVKPPGPGGELVVLAHARSTTFFQYPEGGCAGIEYELARRFAGEHGYRLRFIVLPQFSEVLPALASRRGHLATAGITMTPELAAQFAFAPACQEVSLEVI